MDYEDINIVFKDENFIVCIKPDQVLSTDEPGGLPERIRATLKDPQACIKTVHRLDQVVSGLIVVSRNSEAARYLSKQIDDGTFQKSYLAVVNGVPEKKSGVMKDYLKRDPYARKSFVTENADAQSKYAELKYFAIATEKDKTLLKIKLMTGRTHQIRCQMASREMPIVGDYKYGDHSGESEKIALWSHEISFISPTTKKRVTFMRNPELEFPWSLFAESLKKDPS